MRIANAYVIFEPGIITCVNFFRCCMCVNVNGGSNMKTNNIFDIIIYENVQFQILWMMRKVYADACEFDNMKQLRKRPENERNREKKNRCSH